MNYVEIFCVELNIPFLSRQCDFLFHAGFCELHSKFNFKTGEKSYNSALVEGYFFNVAGKIGE